MRTTGPTTTRRAALKGGLAAAAAIGLPGRLTAQTAPSRARTLRAVIHGDIGSFDPIWTTANVTSYHGGLVYDTLFSADAAGNPQPQMVGKHGVSDDRKTYTFELRDGLKFSDGNAVTAADCVASIRRWAARDGFGQHMFLRVADTPVMDQKTFRIVLKEPYGMVLDALAKLGTNVCYVMRKAEAETDPMQQIKEIVGSGPCMLNRDMSKQGVAYVYDRRTDYVPRSEPVDGSAGGKVMKLDRIVIDNIRDEQTAVAALQSGEIDFMESPPFDLLDQLEGNKDLKLQILNPTGNMGWLRMNFLHPPFDNVKARQAVLHLINQKDFMQATFANAKYTRSCGSLFACGTPMENDANTDWFKGAPNLARARQLLQESGYDGRPIVILQATTIAFMNNSAELLAQALRQIGANVQLAAADWGGIVQRRASKAAPDQGGWNMFITWATGSNVGNPISLAGHAAVGDKGWFGWPSDARHEELRNAWAAAPTLDARKAVARQMQENAWNFVPHAYLGQWVQPAAYRANIKGVIGIPELLPFWNIERA
jgi:peptide/nickel transport system substrate-binding protein